MRDMVDGVAPRGLSACLPGPAAHRAPDGDVIPVHFFNVESGANVAPRGAEV